MNQRKKALLNKVFKNKTTDSYEMGSMASYIDKAVKNIDSYVIHTIENDGGYTLRQILKDKDVPDANKRKAQDLMNKLKRQLGILNQVKSSLSSLSKQYSAMQ